MSGNLDVSLLSTDDANWSGEIDRLRALLGAPNNPLLLPPHYVKATLPKIGGKVAVARENGEIVGAGFLFPRAVCSDAIEFTLRYHKVDRHAHVHRDQLVERVEALLRPDKVVYYDPHGPLHFQHTTEIHGGIEIGRPDHNEAVAVRTLQEEIWRSKPDFLYPIDMHSSDFDPCSSLIARINREPVGFLFGVRKFGGPPIPHDWELRHGGHLRLESQLLGILPRYRSRGLATTLKAVQANQAREQGIAIINWTVDPLQFSNAVLNFGRLKAVAFDFYPNFYEFTNELNHVSASRFAITWLIRTERVHHALAEPNGVAIVELANNTTIKRINDGFDTVHPVDHARTIAIEIPADWTTLQKEKPEQAWKWREITDKLFADYLGCQEGQYVITGVGEDGDRKYLIAHRWDHEMIHRLGI